MKIPKKELFETWGIDEKTEIDRSRILAFVYMLDSHTIGIIHKGSEGWQRISPFWGIFNIRIEKTEARIDLPLDFVRFYGLDRPDTKSVLTINGKNLLITVTSE